MNIHDEKTYFLIKENDTFNIENFSNEQEILKIENWFNKIGETIDLEKIPLKISKEEKDKLIEILGINIPLHFKNEISTIIENIRQFFELEKNIIQIKKKAIHYKQKNETKKTEHFLNLNDEMRPISTKNAPIINEKKIDPYLNCAKNIGIECANNIDGSFYFIDKNENKLLEKYAKSNGFQGFFKKQKLEAVIVYHQDTNSTFILEEPDEIDLNLLLSQKQTFTNKIQIYDNKIIVIAKELFDEKIFDNEEKFNERLEMFKKLTTEEKVIENEIDEKILVQKYMTDTFNITENLEDKLKASYICELVENYLEYNISGFKPGNISFRNKLSKYLLDMGLKKKRFGDGFYYYGLKFIPFPKNNENNNENFEDSFQKIIEKRTNDLFSFYNP